MEVVVRVFVETSEEQKAIRIADFLAKRLGGVGTLQSRKIEQYWKIPEYFEVMLVLQAINPEEWCEQATDKLGTGWETLGPTEAVWNSGEGHTFALEEVRWAQVELIS